MAKIKITKKTHPDWTSIQELKKNKITVPVYGINYHIGEFMYEYKTDKHTIILFEINDGRANNWTIFSSINLILPMASHKSFVTFEEADKKIKELLA